MGWSLSFLGEREPQLTAGVLLAAGKALYLANAFESKCTYVLRSVSLATMVKDDPVLELEEAIAALPRDKMLGGTLRDLSSPSLRMVEAAESALLEKAREARNYIAHEGANFGALWAVRRQRILDHLETLRGAVLDLAAGDNIVSTWIYEIEEREPAPRHMVAEYPAMVEQWVFGHLGDNGPAANLT